MEVGGGGLEEALIALTSADNGGAAPASQSEATTAGQSEATTAGHGEMKERVS